MLGQQLETVEQRLHRGIEPIQLLQLQCQAFREIARGDADRIELLQFLQNGLDQLERAAEALRKRLEIALHVARFVDQIDDLQTDQPRGRIGDLDAELLLQMLAQREVARQRFLVVAVLVGEVAAADPTRQFAWPDGSPKSALPSPALLPV